MDVEFKTKGLEIQHNANNEVEPEIIDITVRLIICDLLKSVLSSIDEGLTYKEISKKFISITHKKEISDSDDRTRVICRKIFNETNLRTKNLPALLRAFVEMNKQTYNQETASLFLGSFVWPKAKALAEKLQTK